MKPSPRDGWVLAVRDDPSGRRGIWYRRGPEAIELRSGREGDDHALTLYLPPRQQAALAALLEHGRDPGICYPEEDAEELRTPHPELFGRDG